MEVRGIAVNLADKALSDVAPQQRLVANPMDFGAALSEVWPKIELISQVRKDCK